MLIITTKCTCGHLRTWESMKTVRGTPLVNLLGCGAITFSGASPTKVLNLFKFINIPFVCYRTFNRIQRGFVLPAIDTVWRKRQASILEECRGREVKAGGDARCCTPGHSAKYGSCTVMDLETGQVLAVEYRYKIFVQINKHFRCAWLKIEYLVAYELGNSAKRFSGKMLFILLLIMEYECK